MPETNGSTLTVAEYDRETVRLIEEAERRLRESRLEMEEVQAEAKERKESFAACQRELQRLIRERKTGLDELRKGQNLLPFTAKPEVQPLRENGAAQKRRPQAKPAAAEPTP